MYRFPSLFRPPCRPRDRRAQLELDKRSTLSIISGSQVEDFSVSQPPLPVCPPPEPLTPVRRAGADAELLKPATDSDNGDRSPLSSAHSSPTRMKSSQRWLKLRTTVQLSGALATAGKQKPTLKREDSFITRFSTRQIIETQDTVEDHLSENEKEKGTNDAGPRSRRKKPPWSVINPDESFYFFWLFLLTLCVLYNVWTLIVRQAFPELQENWQQWWLAGDAFSDFIYVCDIIVQLRTGYLEQGLMVYDSHKLARHYVLSRPFALDLVSVVPLDLLQLTVGVCPMLRCPRFVKVYRTRCYYYMVESRTVFPNVWRVAMLVHVLLLLAHWFGCFYYLLSEAEEFRGDWAYPHGDSEEFGTLTRKYLASVYWSTLTLTTIGDLPTPHTNNQYLFTIVSYLIGVFIFATIVGQVGNVITNRNANRLEFERLLDSAKLYMRHHRVPRAMQRRVQRWYDYSWSRGHIQGGGDINAVLGLLPDKLRTELALHVNLMTLKKVTIFKACQPEFLHDLVLKMRAYIFTPGDLICRKGEVAREMFIIADGILEVISDSGKVLTTMKAGDFFGEIGILNLDGLNKRTADVRSVGYSELFSLSRDNVLSAMRDYPEAQEILQTLGRRRLLEARKASGGRVVPNNGLSAGEHPPPAAADPERGAGSAHRRRPEVIKHALRRVRRVDSDADMELVPCSSDEPQEGQGHASGSGRTRSSQRRRKLGSTASPDGGGSVGREPSTEPEVIGAGLPLLQRLRMLRDRQAAERPDVTTRSDHTESKVEERRAGSGRPGPPASKPSHGHTSRDGESTDITPGVTVVSAATQTSDEDCEPSSGASPSPAASSPAAWWPGSPRRSEGQAAPSQESPPGSDSAERRGLKSILRRLADPTEAPAAPPVPATVQGYLSRKRNLMKSVSFNQHSPPGSPVGSREALPDVTSQATPPPPTACLIQASDVVAEIRSLLQEKLTEMHASLNTRMESLEKEMRERDRILQELYSQQQCQNAFGGKVEELAEDSDGSSSPPDSASDLTCLSESVSQDRLWTLEFGHRRPEHTVVDVGPASSDPAPAAAEPADRAPAEPDEWEVQMLVAEMARSERRQRRSLVPELTVSELELLARLEGGQQPARAAAVGRMASVDGGGHSEPGGRPARPQLGRISDAAPL
ncbi:potassium voltage-gated channel subfamily H member 2-like [Amphibalanus amphitrite]|uniref:potassium voltage-gated channel subfamily H member 2-like n=1 Tax=Amphibalanus amphitrite TaxID=1232801 RepID=UPI001C9097D1|nr:potassium voltage-gated channel subfamily H member 2-like [Amphibalanus amphitrite]